MQNNHLYSSINNQNSATPRSFNASVPPEQFQSATTSHSVQTGHELENRSSYNSYTVYGSNSAFCFNFTERNGVKIILIDGASIFSGSRRFDWASKISLMVTESELPYFLSVLYGWLPSFEGKFHGSQKNKSFKVENQQGKIFFSLSLAGRSIAAPIGGSDAFYLLAKVMSHISSSYRCLSVADIAYLLQATTVRLSYTP